MDEKTLKELVKATKAVFLVQFQALEERADRDKPEVVLARAGYGAAEIAKLLNRGQAAVAKAIQRAGKAA
jgi:DNA-directed RNA polymerase specialized sigma24 family protein